MPKDAEHTKIRSPTRILADGYDLGRTVSLDFRYGFEENKFEREIYFSFQMHQTDTEELKMLDHIAFSDIFRFYFRNNTPFEVRIPSGKQPTALYKVQGYNDVDIISVEYGGGVKQVRSDDEALVFIAA